MSLDVYLTTEDTYLPTEHIYIREDGQVKEISRAEWDARNPGVEPVTMIAGGNEVYSRNITHNLNDMADAADIYKELWRPDEIGITHAHQLIEPLRAGLARLLADPIRFEAMNPSNGWGTYDGLVNFVSGYLAACEQHPTASVSVSR